jgi:hypothetical protein
MDTDESQGKKRDRKIEDRKWEGWGKAKRFNCREREA